MLLRCASLLLAASVLAQDYDERYCVAQNTVVTCTYTNATEKARFVVPAVYNDMTIELASGSGGAALHLEDRPDFTSRGLGVQMALQVKDHLEQGDIFEIGVGMNGHDALIDKPGVNQRTRYGIGGDGGYCYGRFNRYGAAGGTMTSLLYKTGNLTYAKLDLGAGGGSGGQYGDYDSTGANAPLITKLGVVSPGFPGSPSKYGGQGASPHTPGRGGVSKKPHGWDSNGQNGIRDGSAGDGGSNEDVKICLSGGGGGSGHLPGGGGAATGGEASQGRKALKSAAGGGGSGSSYMMQLRPIFSITSQGNAFTETPTVVIRYTAEAASASPGASMSWRELSNSVASQCERAAAAVANEGGRAAAAAAAVAGSAITDGYNSAIARVAEEYNVHVATPLSEYGAEACSIQKRKRAL